MEKQKTGDGEKPKKGHSHVIVKEKQMEGLGLRQD